MRPAIDGIKLMSEADDSVERIPLLRLFPLALQPVRVMYAGAVVVPLLIGRALKLSPEHIAYLVSADLFMCGIVTIIQSIGGPGVGIRLPVMMGVTFVAVGPMLSMAATPEIGLLGIYGSVIAAGIFGFLVAPFVGRLLPFFPPVVTGTIILVIGISLMRVGIHWAGGGTPTMTRVIGEETGIFPNPAYGQLQGLAIASFVLLVIVALIKWGTNFVASIAVLLGILAGTTLAGTLGLLQFEHVGTAPWFGAVLPFYFGMPEFHLIPIMMMCIVMTVVMIESTGMFMALAEITGKRIDQAALVRGLRADGLGTLLGGVFNTFPYTSYSQNVGLVGVSGVRSRFVTACGGAILVVLGLVPKLAALVEAVPQVVIGGAGLVMFGMVAATGVRILAAVDFKTNRFNLFIVAIAIGFGMIPLVSPGFFRRLPDALQPLLDSGILLSAIIAVILNAFFNGRTPHKP